RRAPLIGAPSTLRVIPPGGNSPPGRPGGSCQDRAMSSTRLCIVTPALASANNGNWHTAARWQRFLRADAEVELASVWDGQPAHALIALHARRSAASIDAFHAAHPARPLALVLTGT